MTTHSEHPGPHLRHMFTAADRAKAAAHRSHTAAHAQVDEVYQAVPSQAAALETAGSIDPAIDETWGELG